MDATETKKDGSQVSHHYDADCVIVASGVHSDDALTAQLTAAGIDAVSIGNCHQLGKAIQAIKAGAEIGLTV